MSKLSGISMFYKRHNSGLKPIANKLGSLYSATNILSSIASNGDVIPPPPSLNNLTLNDSSNLTLSTGQPMEIMS